MLEKRAARILVIFLCLGCIPLSGCAEKAAEVPEPSEAVSMEADVPVPVEPADIDTEMTILPEPTETAGIDVDLTALSATAVYGEVYDMMCYPKNYVGKTIRMEGLYSDYLDEATGKHYYACIIMDATACCAQGIEFVLNDDYKYPEDYPKEGDDIVVEGIFSTYEESGGMYCTLKEASLLDQ